MKIGVFGGSFNPFHEGHLKIAQIAIKKLKLDQLWLVPTAKNPFKEEFTYDIIDRTAQISSKIKSNPKVKVKNFRSHSISTFKMLNLIKAQNPKDDFIFIMGFDNIEKLQQWDNFDRLIKNHKLAFFSRDDYFLKLKKYKSYQNIVRFNKDNLKNLIFRIKNVNISSTILRNSKK